MKFLESTENDIEQLSEWIQNDPYHRDCLDPHWWLTGQGFLSFCVQDSKGPTMYVRLDKDGELLRLHIQFAPESEVSKLRVIKSILWGLPKIELMARAHNLKGFIFKSNSLSLINFMKNKFGFISINSDDYQMLFEV
jgi:hypothetical protein